MLKFCECGSIITNGTCSNNKCGKTQFERELERIFDKIKNSVLTEKELRQIDGALMVASSDLIAVNETEETYIFYDHKISDLAKINFKFNFKAIVCDTEKEDEQDVVFNHTKSISIKEARGKINKLYPYLIQQQYLFVNKQIHSYRRSTVIYGYKGNYQWECVSNDVEKSKTLDEYHSNKIQASLGFAYTQMKLWQVYIKRSDSPVGFNIVVDTVSMKELFKARDIKEGHKRRTALKHWVRTHTKHRKGSTEDLIEISKYMRGDMTFTFDNYSCEIKPSAVDLIELEKIKKEKMSC